MRPPITNEWLVFGLPAVKRSISCELLLEKKDTFF